MQTRYPLILFAGLFGLALAATALLSAHAASAAWLPRMSGTSAAPQANAIEGITRTTQTIIPVYCLDVSNEAPGYFVDYLVAQGYGERTFMQVLDYLKPQSNGIISDTFYNQVAGAPPDSFVFTTLNDYFEDFEPGFEICDNGEVWPGSQSGRWFADNYPGWALETSQDVVFKLSYAPDPTQYVNYRQICVNTTCWYYYLWAIAWRDSKMIFLPLTMKN
jgi:hypothetical protein